MQVFAAEPWNDAQINVAKNQKLSIRASGQWMDAGQPYGPEGYDSRRLKAFEWLRRVPKARWFELIGCIDKRLDQCFVIGTEPEVVAPAAGELYLFANDVRCMYWNNSGYLTVEISRLEG
jgi:hypothetical protein